jgi:hypothetical protein
MGESWPAFGSFGAAGFAGRAALDGVRAWTSMPGVHMSGWGGFNLVLGVVVTIGLGAGLMALVFHSSRHDHDC